MVEWLAIALWHQCASMAKPGIVFEIRNREGQSMLTECVASVPAAPFDWKSPPAEFRAVPEPKPRRSDPLPAPVR
jgi:hypothetical protein